MRLWLSGPRILGGLVRPGISLGKEDFRSARKMPVIAVNATRAKFSTVLRPPADRNNSVTRSFAARSAKSLSSCIGQFSL
jgi:hypothetical protein